MPPLLFYFYIIGQQVNGLDVIKDIPASLNITIPTTEQWSQYPRDVPSASITMNKGMKVNMKSSNHSVKLDYPPS